MKNILLPTDFSENSWNAINYAISFFENVECNFYLLHVITVNTMVLEESNFMLDHNALDDLHTIPAKKKLQGLLQRISKQSLNQENHKFYTLTDYNFFIESVRKTVEEKHVDLIVMGTKGASGLEKYILGTNTADIITKVKCNTLAIPENSKFVRPKEIAFANDFSLSHNLQVLQPVSDILKRFQSSLRIVHIKKNNTDLSDDEKKNKELIEDFFTNKNYSFHYLTNKKVEDAIQCFVESRDINMICMVAKNLNYFQQILFHSKIENISYHTDIPFLILHK